MAARWIRDLPGRGHVFLQICSPCPAVFGSTGSHEKQCKPSSKGEKHNVQYKQENNVTKIIPIVEEQERSDKHSVVLQSREEEKLTGKP